ncbi:hypothetical protein BVG81_003955 [Haliangium sp. UPWRP_2]|nr:hypothetical protein BVG81_003955 [Haliangium sp. UPWRP_2]
MSKRDSWSALQLGLSIVGTVAGIAGTIATIAAQRRKVVIVSSGEFAELDVRAQAKPDSQSRMSFESHDFKVRQG